MVSVQLAGVTAQQVILQNATVVIVRTASTSTPIAGDIVLTSVSHGTGTSTQSFSYRGAGGM